MGVCSIWKSEHLFFLSFKLSFPVVWVVFVPTSQPYVAHTHFCSSVRCFWSRCWWSIKCCSAWLCWRKDYAWVCKWLCIVSLTGKAQFPLLPLSAQCEGLHPCIFYTHRENMVVVGGGGLFSTNQTLRGGICSLQPTADSLPLHSKWHRRRFKLCPRPAHLYLPVISCYSSDDWALKACPASLSVSL